MGQMKLVIKIQIPLVNKNILGYLPKYKSSLPPLVEQSKVQPYTYNSERLDNKCIFISCTLGAFKCTTIIDFGCSAYGCIRDTLQVFTQELFSNPQTLKSYDGKVNTTTHLVKIRMSLANNAHQEDVPMFVMLGLHYNVILGMPWLKRHKPIIE